MGRYINVTSTLYEGCIEPAAAAAERRRLPVTTRAGAAARLSVARLSLGDRCRTCKRDNTLRRVLGVAATLAARMNALTVALGRAWEAHYNTQSREAYTMVDCSVVAVSPTALCSETLSNTRLQCVVHCSGVKCHAFMCTNHPIDGAGGGTERSTQPRGSTRRTCGA